MFRLILKLLASFKINIELYTSISGLKKLADFTVPHVLLNPLLQCVHDPFSSKTEIKFEIQIQI